MKRCDAEALDERLMGEVSLFRRMCCRDARAVGVGVGVRGVRMLQGTLLESPSALRGLDSLALSSGRLVSLAPRSLPLPLSAALLARPPAPPQLILMGRIARTPLLRSEWLSFLAVSVPGAGLGHSRRSGHRHSWTIFIFLYEILLRDNFTSHSNMIYEF